MVGIVLCSHSNFAQGLKDAVEMIAGPQANFEAVCFDGNTDLIELSEEIKAVSSQFAQGLSMSAISLTEPLLTLAPWPLPAPIMSS